VLVQPSLRVVAVQLGTAERAHYQRLLDAAKLEIQTQQQAAADLKSFTVLKLINDLRLACLCGQGGGRGDARTESDGAGGGSSVLVAPAGRALGASRSVPPATAAAAHPADGLAPRERPAEGAAPPAEGLRMALAMQQWRRRRGSEGSDGEQNEKSESEEGGKTSDEGDKSDEGDNSDDSLFDDDLSAAAPAQGKRRGALQNSADDDSGGSGSDEGDGAAGSAGNGAAAAPMETGSAKVACLLHELQAAAAGSRSLVFSFFAGKFLRGPLLQCLKSCPLRRAGLRVQVLDGTVTKVTERQAIVKWFQQEGASGKGGHKVLLLSTGVGGEGLNLTVSFDCITAATQSGIAL
jgi:hypothetical protein